MLCIISSFKGKIITMNKIDSFKFPHLLICNAIASKREPNPFLLFDSLKKASYDSFEKGEIIHQSNNLAKSLFDRCKPVAGLLYAFIAQSTNIRQAADNAAMILLSNREMNPFYAYKISKCLKNFYNKSMETKDLAQMMGAYEKQYINKSLKALNNPKYSDKYLSYYLNRDLMRKS